jgi:hypothetical protein
MLFVFSFSSFGRYGHAAKGCHRCEHRGLDTPVVYVRVAIMSASPKPPLEQVAKAQEQNISLVLLYGILIMRAV